MFVELPNRFSLARIVVSDSTIALVVVFVFLGLLGIIALSRRAVGRSAAPQNTSARTENLPWEELFEKADQVVKETRASLPAAIKAEAERVPCILDKWPPSDSDMLGVYMTFRPDAVSEAPGPILLYLGSIYEECQEHDLDFAEEVKITFLHELGHHLGLEESDLDERGLG